MHVLLHNLVNQLQFLINPHQILNWQELWLNAIEHL